MHNIALGRRDETNRSTRVSVCFFFVFHHNFLLHIYYIHILFTYYIHPRFLRCHTYGYVIGIAYIIFAHGRRLKITKQLLLSKVELKRVFDIFCTLEPEILIIEIDVFWFFVTDAYMVSFFI